MARNGDLGSLWETQALEPSSQPSEKRGSWVLEGPSDLPKSHLFPAGTWGKKPGALTSISLSQWSDVLNLGGFYSITLWKIGSVCLGGMGAGGAGVMGQDESLTAPNVTEWSAGLGLVTLFATPQTPPQGPLSRGILQARVLEWVACPPPGDLPNPGIQLGLPHCRWILDQLSHQENQRRGFKSVWDSSQVEIVIKNPPANARDTRDVGSVPRSGRSPVAGHGNPLQYSCLENPMDRGAWWATVHRVTKRQTWLSWLSTHASV